MATKKTSSARASAPPTKAALTKMMKQRTNALHTAIEQQIAGIPGIKLHSVRFAVDANVAPDPCGGKCRPGQVCLLSSSGQWVCV